MDPRKIGAWVARLVLSAGIVAAVSLGAQGAAQASAASQATSDSGISTTLMEPEWG